MAELDAGHGPLRDQETVDPPERLDLGVVPQAQVLRGDPALDGGELACSRFDLPVTRSTSTHHFRVLRESGVVRQVYRGTAKMTALRRAALDDLFPGLLDALLDAADRQAVRLGG
ncbi:winged helix-turn-helix domain-containing protein [Streptomyces sp. NPDC087294]|uniref:helix-turn-helix domain-containing protein n=1 Tax=Streptomyces sp. NPDC087294 TaxID=3365777 RepID=UPI003829D52B